VSALEVHGPHLPLGMDWFMARWMAEETARRFAEHHPEWTVVALPALSIGADELPLRGSMSVPARTLYRAVVAHGRALAKAGYGFVVVTNGHGSPRHAAALGPRTRWCRAVIAPRCSRRGSRCSIASSPVGASSSPSGSSAVRSPSASVTAS
jgi:hypothetical protein